MRTGVIVYQLRNVSVQPHLSELTDIPETPVLAWSAVNHSSGMKPSLTLGLSMGLVRRGKLTRSRSGFSAAAAAALAAALLVERNATFCWRAARGTQRIRAGNANVYEI